jgi:hypothetical protein
MLVFDNTWKYFKGNTRLKFTQLSVLYEYLSLTRFIHCTFSHKGSTDAEHVYNGDTMDNTINYLSPT